MNLYNKLARNPRLFLSFTGMHLHSFKELLPLFEQAYFKLELKRKERLVRTGRKRKRAAGAGKPFSNDLTNRLLMLLTDHSLLRPNACTCVNRLRAISESGFAFCSARSSCSASFTN